MSKTSLLLLAGILGLFIISLFFVLRRSAPPERPNGLSGDESLVVLLPQENSGGDVNIKVAPKVIKVGEKPEFDLEFNTHSVELDFDIEIKSILSDDLGNSYGKPTWEGSPPGGHHRSGSLTFPDPLKETKSITLVLKDISGVASREFSWQL